MRILEKNIETYSKKQEFVFFIRLVATVQFKYRNRIVGNKFAMAAPFIASYRFIVADTATIYGLRMFDSNFSASRHIHVIYGPIAHVLNNNKQSRHWSLVLKHCITPAEQSWWTANKESWKQNREKCYFLRIENNKHRLNNGENVLIDLFRSKTNGLFFVCCCQFHETIFFSSSSSYGVACRLISQYRTQTIRIPQYTDKDLAFYFISILVCDWLQNDVNISFDFMCGAYTRLWPVVCNYLIFLQRKFIFYVIM